MTSVNEKEMLQLKNRLKELADKSSRQGIYTFTPFLGLNEQNVFWQIERELGFAGYMLFGGCENCDRVIVRFGNPDEFGYEVDFPVKCIHITPLLPKFADELSHRDFLGAVMNLGIDRGTIGDIKVGDKEAFLFCTEGVAEYICGNLDKIKHTNVKCAVTKEFRQMTEEEPERRKIQIASERLDAVIAKAYNKSRSECIEFFRAGKVFVDGRLCENNSLSLRGGETVNVRGFGKFVYVGETGLTKKGRLSAELLIYK